jgi:hypothetical protein
MGELKELTKAREIFYTQLGLNELIENKGNIIRYQVLDIEPVKGILLPSDEDYEKIRNETYAVSGLIGLDSDELIGSGLKKTFEMYNSMRNDEAVVGLDIRVRALRMGAEGLIHFNQVSSTKLKHFVSIGDYMATAIKHS